MPATVSQRPATPVLLWTFQRDNHVVTCGLDARSDRSFDVFVVPHADVSSSLVEHFDAPTGALMRHAQYAQRLRDTGWVLTDYVGADHPPAAA